MLQTVLVCAEAASHIRYISNRALDRHIGVRTFLFRRHLCPGNAQPLQGNRRNTDIEHLTFVSANLGIHRTDAGNIDFHTCIRNFIFFIRYIDRFIFSRISHPGFRNPNVHFKTIRIGNLNNIAIKYRRRTRRKISSG